MAVAMLMAAGMMAQQPVITFNETTHDFGKINESDGKVTTVFTFKNEGATPLVLSNVKASCGCTTPKWTKEPVEPGQEGLIHVTYNPNGRPGRFQKTITVTSNATEATTRLFIKGEVIPKTTTPVDQYPVKIGAMSLKSQTVDMGNMFADTAIIKTLEYANQTNDTIRVQCISRNPYLVAYASAEKEEEVIAPRVKGSLHILFDTKVCRMYGPVESEFHLVINGKEDMDHAIRVKANIQEDFSHMTAKEMERAPFAEMSKNINLGTFAADKKGVATFHITNAGLDPLMIRRVIVDKEKLLVTNTKKIASGKKGAVKVMILPMQAGNYSSEITIITNDPKRPVITETIHWTIEK